MTLLSQTRLTGDELAWDLMKFCKGFNAKDISICTVKDGQHLELTLDNWEGDTKSEKVRTLAGVMDVEYYDDIDIILPNSFSYNF